MIDKIITDNCTGCYACQNICSLNAIQLVPNKEGFVYPTVDYTKCIHCTQCVANCPSLATYAPDTTFPPFVYAAWHRENTIRLESTSGGVFSALAEAVLNRNGYVVGAYYDSNFQISHTIIHRSEDLALLRQSKYAQSRINNVFRTIKDLLQHQQTVLFCGTPCQVAGLQKYLKKDYANLLCCDFICRGVISPKVYQKFLSDMHPNNHAQLEKVHFKNKEFGWNCFSTKLSFDDGSTYHMDRDHDYYMRGYLKHNLYLRPSCHQCQYKTLPRISDISLGDFWGIGNYDPTLDNDAGTSVVLVNSCKGQQLFSWAADQLQVHPRTLEEVLSGNSCLLHSAPEGKYRNYFFKHIDHCTFSELIERIEHKSSKLKITDRILQALSRVKRMFTGVLL